MTRPGQHLAHFNWAELVADSGSAEVAGFEDTVPKINALAERSAGFVWRDGDERERACAIGWSLFSDNPRLTASFSVWEDPQSLSDFVYATVHGAFLRRAEEWFVRGTGQNHALWWVPKGHVPSMQEARDRVDLLLERGPSGTVFDFGYLEDQT